jgi:chromosome segregation ATPase
MASPPVNRLAAAETARDAERHARLRAERALAEAQAALRNLQTQVGHATMTQDEAVETARRAVADRDVLEAALAAERHAREHAEQALAKALERRGRAAQRLADPATPMVPRKARVAITEREPRVAKKPDAVKKPPRAGRRAAEPKPVKWWVKPRG